MAGTSCADVAVEAFPSAAALPPDAQVLLGEGTELFGTGAWWNVVLAHAMPAQGKAVFLTITVRGRAVAMVPLLRTGRNLSSLTTPYTCSYMPSLAHGLDRATRVAAMTALSDFCRRAGIVRFDALPAEWDGLPDLEAGARRSGLVPLRFDHFGNWFEDVHGLDWSAYLVRRPGALRETIRRRMRPAEKLARAGFELMCQPDQMDRAAAVFEFVYAKSWKDAEPYSTFNTALMRALAPLGLLRVGIWSIGAEPAAVQMWVVMGGRATVLKLAHDEAFKAHSPGTVLTALMLRHLLDTEQVSQIDFGRGDDAYKQGWAIQRRQRVGMLLVDPWRPSGMAALARHAAGRAAIRLTSS